MSDVSELVSRLRRLAEQQADGTDFHQGRLLTENDTMYAVAADKLESLQSTVSRLREALENALDYMRGNISGPAQRDGIIQEGDEALKDIQSMKDGD